MRAISYRKDLNKRIERKKNGEAKKRIPPFTSKDVLKYLAFQPRGVRFEYFTNPVQSKP